MNENSEVEKQNETEQNFINGEAKTFKTGQVAKILNETPAMIRVYCRDFPEFIKIEHKQGEHRSFSKANIEELKYVIYLLKEKNYSTKQAREYLSTPEGKLMQPIIDDKERIAILVGMLEKGIRPIIKEELDILVKSNNENKKEINDRLRRIESMTQDKLGSVIENTESLKSSIDKIHEIEKNNIERSKRVEDLITEFRNKDETKKEKKTSFLFKLFSK